MTRNELKEGAFYIIPPTEIQKFTSIGIPEEQINKLCNGKPHQWKDRKFDCWKTQWAFSCIEFKATEVESKKVLSAQAYANKYKVYLAKDYDGEWFAYDEKPSGILGKTVWIGEGPKQLTDKFGKCLDELIVFPEVEAEDSLISPKVETKPKVKLTRGDPIFVWDDGASEAIPAQVRYYYSHGKSHGNKVVFVFDEKVEGEKGVWYDHFRKYDPELVGVPRKDWPAE